MCFWCGRGHDFGDRGSCLAARGSKFGGRGWVLTAFEKVWVSFLGLFDTVGAILSAFHGSRELCSLIFALFFGRSWVVKGGLGACWDLKVGPGGSLSFFAGRFRAPPWGILLSWGSLGNLLEASWGVLGAIFGGLGRS